MPSSNSRRTARRRLDRKLTSADNLDLVTPRSGWVRAIRDALGMPRRVMAERLKVTEQAVYGLERSEVAGTVQLGTLRRAADALECDLLYTFVPRQSLEVTIRAAAGRRATADLAAIDQTMRLEGQQLDEAELEIRLSDYIDELIEGGRVWT